MRHLLRPALTLVLAGLAGGPGLVAPSRGADDVCALEGVPRVVAVGDVHGSYDGLVAVLRLAGLVDQKTRWSGGKAHLVQVGDFLDRGKDTRTVVDLLMRLQKDAAKAGGRVHVLLGNHEVMNLVGDLRYVNPEEYQLFRTPRSLELQQLFYESARQRTRDAAKAAGREFDEPAFRTKFLEEAPLGFVERTQALSAEGAYGRWLRERPVVVRINRVVFVHGGLTPETAALGCAGINARVRRELTEDFEKTQADSLASLTAGETGPLWYRGLAREDETLFAPAVDKVLAAMGARAVVVGHSVAANGRITTRFGGRVVMIDAGMSDSYGGHRAALEIDKEGAFLALYPDAAPQTLPAVSAAR